MTSGVRFAMVWGSGLMISAISYIMYNMFAKFQFFLGNFFINMNAPAAVQMQLNNLYNWGFIIMGSAGIIIPALWTFFREKREREYV